MVITRTHWIGKTQYTSQVDGRQNDHDEHIVMVQAFDEDGVRFPYFKAAYIDDDTNKVKLKLSFNVEADQDNPAQDPLNTQFYYMKSNFMSPQILPDMDNSVGALDIPYPARASGCVKAWTNRHSQLFQTWNYVDYWGFAAGAVFKDDADDPTPLIVNGHGHVGKLKDGPVKLVRTMCYSTKVNGVLKPYYVKSSVLERQDIETSDNANGFKDFI